MKEHPIPFRTELVKAILEGRKTQTRRVVKLPKWMGKYNPDLKNAYADGGVFATGAYLKVPLTSGDMAETVQRVFCPYGYPYSPDFLIERGSKVISPGLEEMDMQPMKPEDADRLWVRETWLESPIITDKMLSEGADTWAKCYYYASETPQQIEQLKEWGWKVKPSRFMPRWASRIDLEIMGIRVQRVQEISLADLQAEGIPDDRATFNAPKQQAKFKALWDSINGKKHPWSSNPWVWVIEFKRIKPFL